MLGSDDIGRRVVVRRIAGVRDNRPIFTDLLGYLTAASETGITVRTKGGTYRVPRAEIHRAKTVPDRRRLSATEALELAAAAGWPAGEQARLGDWWLRATADPTMRGGSALPIGDPGCATGEAIDSVESWYRERGLRPAISVPLPLRAGLDAELDRRGWVALPLIQVMTSPLGPLAAALAEPSAAAWLAAVAGREPGLPRPVLTAVAHARFAVVYGEAGAPLAIGRGVVAADERRWVGLSLIETVEPVRRRGYARQVVAALAGWALSVGASDAYVRVERANEPAVGLFTAAGFGTHHGCLTRVGAP